MATRTAMTSTRTGGRLLILGGLIAVPLWLVFTSVHGPTSFNENRITLGRDMHFWGLLLGVIPNALVAAGLWRVRGVLLTPGGSAARVGYGLVLGGLVVSAALDLAFQALGPPLMLPFIAAGLLLLALPERDGPGVDRLVRGVVLALGILFAVAFAWALTPLDVSDRVGGFRIFGLMAHLVGGLGWALLGGVILGRAAGDTAST